MKYRLERFDTQDLPRSTAKLDELASEGWEVHPAGVLLVNNRLLVLLQAHDLPGPGHVSGPVPIANPMPEEELRRRGRPRKVKDGS